MNIRPNELHNMAASVRGRLLNIARAESTDFSVVLARFGAERFLYRLGESSERDHFVLKGAMLFRLWTEQEFRSTRDVDVLGFGPTDHASIRHSIEAICVVDCPVDGLWFDTSTININEIRRAQEYGGSRVKLKAWLGATRIDIQVDVGFGDVVTPEPVEQNYPTLLDHPSPRLKAYPRETFIAEKFEAMVRLGATNTRMKDFWDVAAIATQFGFKGELLRKAVTATFYRRRTVVSDLDPAVLTTVFYQDRNLRKRWDAFRNRVQPGGPAPPEFDSVGELIRDFLLPVFEGVRAYQQFEKTWTPGRGWGELEG